MPNGWTQFSIRIVNDIDGGSSAIVPTPSSVMCSDSMLRIAPAEREKLIAAGFSVTVMPVNWTAFLPLLPW